MSVYCFIFARGGSKGIVDKNIRPFCGKPLIAHTIEFAKALGIFKGIIVSTDSQKIAQVAKEYGASVPFMRPAELAADDSPERLAWRHAAAFVKSVDKDFDTFVSLPCTAPLRTNKTVLNCLELFEKNKDSLILTCCKAHNNPYFNMVSIDESANATLMCQSDVSRRQDAPGAYNISTVAYVCSPDLIQKYDHIFKGPVKAVVADGIECIDIDDIVDFKVAEFLFKERENGQLFS